MSVLERHIRKLSDDKSELNNAIHSFNVQYHDKLGDLIEKILNIRKERYQEAAEQDDDYQEQYEEAKEDYNSFHQEHQEVTEQEPPAELDLQDSNKLKKLYRQASKLCHPDIVADDNKEKAQGTSTLTQTIPPILT